MLISIVISWEKVAGVLAGLVLINTVLKEWFGVTLLGKKIYKGAPSLWKWVMRNAIFKKEVLDAIGHLTKEVARVNNELSYNGGSTVKDQGRKTYEVLVKLNNRVRFNEIRLDVNDIQNERMTAKMNRIGECVAVNDVFLTFFNYSEDDMLRVGFESIIDESDLVRMQQKWRRAVDTKSRFYEEIKMYNKNRKFFYVLMRGFPDIDDAGELHNEYYVTFKIIEKQN